LVAGLTVGGKAVGKTFAMKSATKIVYGVGKIVHCFRAFPQRKQKKNNKS